MGLWMVFGAQVRHFAGMVAKATCRGSFYGGELVSGGEKERKPHRMLIIMSAVVGVLVRGRAYFRRYRDALI
jgi:hypothetical protein